MFQHSDIQTSKLLIFCVVIPSLGLHGRSTQSQSTCLGLRTFQESMSSNIAWRPFPPAIKEAALPEADR